MAEGETEKRENCKQVFFFAFFFLLLSTSTSFLSPSLLRGGRAFLNCYTVVLISLSVLFILYVVLEVCVLLLTG